MLREADVVVVGGGLVGLSAAVELARAGYFVTLLERHARLSLENSSRNSGVVHAGIHHPRDWLKTRLCVRGRELLDRRCEKHGIAYRKLGKLIVARNTSEVSALEALHARARENGAGPTHLLDQVELGVLEENVCGHAALLVEATGVIRTQELVRSLAREAESLGVEVALGMEVSALERDARAESRGRWELRVQGSDDGWVAPCVVIAAGLEADRVARMAGVDTDRHGLTQHFCKGTYFALDERFRKAVGRLVYPVPDVGADGARGLGIHLTRDVDGYLFAGPDSEWIESPDFELDASKANAFAEALSFFRPRVEARDLLPLAAGVRPKLHGPNDPARDFAIRDGEQFGAPGLLVLAGIESPGLTACLAIGEEVAAWARTTA